MYFTRGFSIAGLIRSLRMGFLLGSVIVRTSSAQFIGVCSLCLWRPYWTEIGASDIGLEAATRLILPCHRCGRARHPGIGTPPMVLLTQPSITGVPLMRREVDRLLVVPSTEIRTDGVRPGRRGARRVVVTAGPCPLLGRSRRQGRRMALRCHAGEGRCAPGSVWAMTRVRTGVEPSAAGRVSPPRS